MLLIQGFVVLCISTPGPSQNLTSSSVMSTVANVILLRQNEVIICLGSGVFKTFAGNMLFRDVIGTGKNNFSQKFSSDKMFLCNNSDQT